MPTTMKRREKMFGDGRTVPLDRNAKARIAAFARALSHRTEPGRHYGVLTDKFLTVLRVLLWEFHNAGSGRCFPAYETIADRAHCGRTTVHAAINALERAGVLSWVNRIARVREVGADLFGRAANRWRVIRTSNQYVFVDPQPAARPPSSSEFKFSTGTEGQEIISSAPPTLDPTSPLARALSRLEEGIGAAPVGAARGLST